MPRVGKNLFQRKKQQHDTLQGTDTYISNLWKIKILFKSVFGRDMLVPRRVILCFSRVLACSCSFLVNVHCCWVMNLCNECCRTFLLFASVLHDNSTINAQVPTRHRDSRSKVLHSKLYSKNILSWLLYSALQKALTIKCIMTKL